jgi:FkbM family methyltransferase
MLQKFLHQARILKHYLANCLLYFSLKRKRLAWQLSTGLEISISNASDWWVYKEVFINQDYDFALKCILEKTSHNPIYILDLGANVGYFSLRCLHLHRQLKSINPLYLFSVEGSPLAFRELQSRLSKISSTTEHIHLHHALVGELEGKGFLEKAEQYSQNKISEPKDREGQWIDYINLNTLRPQKEQKWDLIKCDIEGSEYDFVRNYANLLKNTYYFICEFHDFHKAPKYNEAIELIKSYGFAEIDRTPHASAALILVLFKNQILAPTV